MASWTYRRPRKWLEGGLFILLSLCAACAVPSAIPTTSKFGDAIVIETQSVSLRRDTGETETVGRLRYRGGLNLRASHRGFGGWSDLWVAPDGSALRAVSDEGHWLTARIILDDAGGLAALADARIGPLRGPGGQPLADKQDSDAESLARLPDGSWLVGFEMRHRLWRYPSGIEEEGGGLAGIPFPVPVPPDFVAQPMNGGAEALVLLADGRVLALSEEAPAGPDAVVGWIGTFRGIQVDWGTLAYRLVPPFRPTGAAQLPGGDVVVLERAIGTTQPFTARIVRLDASRLQPGAIVEGAELARLAFPYRVDNFEGIAVSRGARGEPLLWLISDDNFLVIQDTLLLVFELLPS